MAKDRHCWSGLLLHVIHLCQHRLTFSKLVLVIMILFAAIGLITQHHQLEPELIQAFQFPASGIERKPPAHLDLVDTAQLQPSDLWSIDEVHKMGLLHEGTFQFILDSDNKLLLTYRAPHMVTCPNTWMPPGEHNRAYENALQTVQRGIEEEFGHLVFNNYVTHITTLTDYPLFYFRNYGSDKYYENRIDQQLTYLWYVQLSQPGNVIEKDITMDKENTKLLWLPLEEVAKWMNGKPQDFCHETITDLMGIGLKRLSDIVNKKQ